MLKWERKLIEQIDRYLPELAWLLVTLAAIWIRRSGLWHVCFDYQNQFYIEEPGYLHTPFYTLLIWLISFVPMTPIRTVKLMISLFDFCAAAGGIALLTELLGKQTDRRVFLTCYALLMISPLTIENGLTWIHLDSVCLSMVLWAAFAWKRKKSVAAGILLGVAAAIQMQYGIFLIVAAICSLKRNRNWLKVFGAGCAVTALLTALGSLWGGLNWQAGMYHLINWVVISPGTGEGLKGVLDWLAAMTGHYAYLAGTGAVLTAFVYPKSKWLAAVVNVFLILYLGQILQYGYWY